MQQPSERKERLGQPWHTRGSGIETGTRTLQKPDSAACSVNANVRRKTIPIMPIRRLLQSYMASEATEGGTFAGKQVAWTIASRLPSESGHALDCATSLGAGTASTLRPPSGARGASAAALPGGRSSVRVYILTRAALSLNLGFSEENQIHITCNSRTSCVRGTIPASS